MLALLIGIPTLRLRDDFLAITTIGMAAILRSVANSVDGLVNRARGLNGLPALPRPSLKRSHRASTTAGSRWPSR